MSELRFSHTESLIESPRITFNLGPSTLSGLTDKVSTTNGESTHYLEKTGVLPSVSLSAETTDSASKITPTDFKFNPSDFSPHSGLTLVQDKDNDKLVMFPPDSKSGTAGSDDDKAKPFISKKWDNLPTEERQKWQELTSNLSPEESKLIWAAINDKGNPNLMSDATREQYENIADQYSNTLKEQGPQSAAKYLASSINALLKSGDEAGLYGALNMMREVFEKKGIAFPTEVIVGKRLTPYA
jgi:hypothetical protein